MLKAAPSLPIARACSAAIPGPPRMPCAVLAAVAALAAAAFLVPSASADTIEYVLCNHPGGAEAPPAYGLRLDYKSDEGSPKQINLFDFEAAGGMTGVIDTNANTLTITGTAAHAVGGNVDAYSGQVFKITAVIELDAPLNVAELTDPSGGFAKVSGSTQSLELELIADNGGPAPDFNGPLDWVGFPMSSGMPDFYIDDNHRGVDGLSGYGWVKPDGGYHKDYQDWLFTMKPVDEPPIPEPATISLLGLALAGMVWRNRRRA